MEFNAIILSFLVSTLVVMTGVGGGSLMAPMLIFGLGISPAIAVGTDLIYAALTKAGALWMYARRAQVRWEMAGWMLVGSVPAALGATGLLWVFRANPDDLNDVIKISLGVALIASAAAIALRDRIHAPRGGAEAGKATALDGAAVPHRGLLMAMGAVVGTLVTLSSVGAGSIGVAALMLLIPTLDTRHAVGTDLAYGVVLAAVAGSGHLLLGSVDLRLLANLLAGMIPGIYLGGWLVGLFPERVLRRVISVSLLGAGLKLI